MRPEYWFIGTGVLLIIMTMIAASLKRLPVTSAIVYLGLGVVLGPSGVGAIHVSINENSNWLEHLTEIAVIISLFTAGLKLRLPMTAPEWRGPLRLATFSMLVTIALVTLVAVYLLSLPFGAAVLLAAIVAPTDPVLAAGVQVLGPEDRDKLRFNLTGEAGFNDGAAFPFVMLGLGLLGHRDLGHLGWRWFVLDGVWAIGGGLLVGTAVATGVSRLVSYLRRKHEETQSLDDLLALGLIAVSYGTALLLGTYGFLAVFAAGLALRRGERRETQGLDFGEETEPLYSRETTTARMAHGVLTFNTQLERMGEIVVVLVLGTMITSQVLSLKFLWLAVVLFFVIRPISVILGAGLGNRSQFPFLAWFGIRGIGSLYYLAFAIGHGISDALANQLTQATLAIVSASILVHGASSAPLMLRYVGRASGKKSL